MEDREREEEEEEDGEDGELDVEVREEKEGDREAEEGGRGEGVGGAQTVNEWAQHTQRKECESDDEYVFGFIRLELTLVLV